MGKGKLAAFTEVVERADSQSASDGEKGESLRREMGPALKRDVTGDPRQGVSCGLAGAPSTLGGHLGGAGDSLIRDVAVDDALLDLLQQDVPHELELRDLLVEVRVGVAEDLQIGRAHV